ARCRPRPSQVPSGDWRFPMATSSGASRFHPAASNCASSASRTVAWWSACAGLRKENVMTLEMDKNQNQTSPEPAPSTAKGDAPALTLPDDALVIIPVRNMILFPGMILPLNLGRESSVVAAQQAVRSERPIGLLLQTDPAIENPGPDDVNRAG